MGTQKKNSETALDSAVVVTGKKARRVGPFAHTKRNLIIIGTLILIGILFGFGWNIFGGGSKTKTSARTPYDKAFDLSLAGKDDQAQAVFDDQLASAKTDTAKSDLYTQKAEIAYNDGKYQEGLQWARQAEQLYPTAASAGEIATNAEGMGNKTLALQYYKLELQRLGTPGIKGGNDWLIAKIKELEG